MRSLLALLFLALSVSGTELEFSNWVVPPKSDPYYPDMSAYVGDTITFTWPVGHIIDVHIHPTGTCEEDYAILVGYHSGSSYTFTEEDAGKKVFFACDVGQRCEAGQNVVVEVAELLQVSSIERGVDSAASKKGVFSALALAAGVAAKMIL